MNNTLALPEVGKFASIETLQEAFPETWVLISEPKRHADLQIEGGIFHFTAPTKQEAYQQLKKMAEIKSFAIVYMGLLEQEGEEFLL
jgi:hypothetical protein